MFRIFVFSLIIIVVVSNLAVGQQRTVGVLSADSERLFEGYNLFYPERQSTTFLIDNCGRIVHSWTDGDGIVPGKEAYLTKDGTLIRAKSDASLTAGSFGVGGSGGVIEERSWDGELLWQMVIADSVFRQHHDIEILPNGNILAIVWEKKSFDEIVELGFDTSTFTQSQLWADRIVEIDPVADSIVWYWSAWDHMIQDYDSSKQNFGDIAAHPELIDINYQRYVFSKPDLHHINGIDYHPELDQIVISSKTFNEIWIIDHSTTIEQAAGHTGGLSGKGGDLLYRWGNPEAYKNGGVNDRMLFFPHDPSWMLDSESQYFGQIILFNNFIGQNLSLGEIVNPQFDRDAWSYPLMNNRFLPTQVTRSISHPDTVKNFSTAGSSIQLLPNGNFLMHAARPGFAFELSDDEDVLWEYKVPMRNGFPVAQGTQLHPSDNFSFSLRRYPLDFPAFLDKDLSPKGYLEINPDSLFCDEIINAVMDSKSHDITIYPNPTQTLLTVLGLPSNSPLLVVDGYGRVLMRSKSNSLDVSFLPDGLYLVLNKQHGLRERFVKF